MNQIMPVTTLYNSFMYIEHIKEILLDQCQIVPDIPTILGISGGADSQVLLHIFNRLKFNAVVCYFDHQLRPESKDEMFVVENLAKGCGMRFISGTRDVLEDARKNKFSVEEAARKARYSHLFQVARNENAQAVAVAHNADDQIETMMMHLLRGTGISGLRGMPYRKIPHEWDDQIAIVRPLLGIWREEIMAYCMENELTPIIDITNLENTYYRNRLRNELIPYLKEYNPQIKNNLWKMSALITDDYSVMKDVIYSTWLKVKRHTGNDFVFLDTTELTRLHTGLQRSILRQGIAQLKPGLKDIDFSCIERARVFIHRPTQTRHLDLIDNLVLEHEGEQILIAKKGTFQGDEDWPNFPTDSMAYLDIPGQYALGYGWILKSELYDRDSNDQQVESNLNQFEAWFDYLTLENPLFLRTRRAGDRIDPLGMNGHSKKLSDYMINHKMPKRARDHWPLVLSSEKIIWVPGYGIADHCKVRQKTRKVMHLCLEKQSTA